MPAASSLTGPPHPRPLLHADVEERGPERFGRPRPGRPLFHTRLGRARTILASGPLTPASEAEEHYEPEAGRDGAAIDHRRIVQAARATARRRTAPASSGHSRAAAAGARRAAHACRAAHAAIHATPAAGATDTARDAADSRVRAAAESGGAWGSCCAGNSSRASRIGARVGSAHRRARICRRHTGSAGGVIRGHRENGDASDEADVRRIVDRQIERRREVTDHPATPAPLRR